MGSRQCGRCFLPIRSGIFRDDWPMVYPRAHLVVGLLADGSGFDKGVYIWRMVMPLFVPIDHVTLTWSERIGGGAKKYYASDDDEIASAVGGAVRLLGDEDTELEGIATNAREDSWSAPHIRTDWLCPASTRIDCRCDRELLSARGSGAASTPTQNYMFERVGLLLQLLHGDRVNEAVDQLDRRVRRYSRCAECS